MSTKKILVVFGATGAQGGSVARAFLSDLKLKEFWTVRGVTRDVTKPSAKAVEELGAELVSADMNDPESLKHALKDAYAAFAVTNFWETMDKEGETRQGKAMADAAKAAGVQHYVWSSLVNVTELSKGALTHVYHFDSKAAVEEYIKTIDLPATFFLPGAYMANFASSAIRPIPPENHWATALPIPASTKIPVLATEEDTGKFVKGILINPEKSLGKRILGATNYITLKELLDDWKELYPEAGKTATNVELPREVFKGILMQTGLPESGAEDLTQNMILMHDFGYYGGEPLEPSHEILVDELTTWKEFASKVPAWADLK